MSGSQGDYLQLKAHVDTQVDHGVLEQRYLPTAFSFPSPDILRMNTLGIVGSLTAPKVDDPTSFTTSF